LIDIKVKSVEANFVQGEAKIQKQYAKVRNDIHMTLEEAHLRLNKWGSEFREKVNFHENESLVQYKSIVEKLVQQSTEYHFKSRGLLKRIKMDKEALKDSLHEANLLLTGLSRFGENALETSQIEFVKNQELINCLDFIGEIKSQKNLIFLKEDSLKIHEIDLKSCFRF
jgi:hypothetical protein